MQPDLNIDGRRLLGPRTVARPRRLGRLSAGGPVVDYAARYVYDYHYQGAGNWPFNAAYASSAGWADVTQLHYLREAEPFIKAGIPLVASVAWESDKLTARSRARTATSWSSAASPGTAT